MSPFVTFLTNVKNPFWLFQKARCPQQKKHRKLLFFLISKAYEVEPLEFDPLRFEQHN